MNNADEKVVIPIMKTKGDKMAAIRSCEMTFVSDDGTIHIELGDGTGIEFKANSVIMAMMYLILG